MITKNVFGKKEHEICMVNPAKYSIPSIIELQPQLASGYNSNYMCEPRYHRFIANECEMGRH